MSMRMHTDVDMSSPAGSRMPAGSVDPGIVPARAMPPIVDGPLGELRTSAPKELAIVQDERVNLNPQIVEGRITRARAKETATLLASSERQSKKLPSTSKEDFDRPLAKKPGPKSKTMKGVKRRKPKIDSSMEHEEDVSYIPTIRTRDRRNPNVPDKDDELVRLKHMPLHDIGTEMISHLDEVKAVAKHSGHLKGTFINKLNCATVMLRAATHTITKRASTDVNIQWLKQHNERLENEVKELRAEVKKLTAALASQNKMRNTRSSVREDRSVEQPVADLPPVLRPSLRGKQKVLTTDPNYDLTIEEREVDALLTQRINHLLDQRTRLRDKTSLETTKAVMVQHHTILIPQNLQLHTDLILILNLRKRVILILIYRYIYCRLELLLTVMKTYSPYL